MPLGTDNGEFCRPNRALGSRSELIVQEESCWGILGEDTTPAAAQEALGWEFRSETLRNDINNSESELIRSDRMRPAPQQGNHRPGGDVTGELQPNGVWPLIMKHALGGAVLTSGSGPYVHLLEGSIDLPEGLSVQKRFAFASGNPKILQYLGCRVASFGITVPSEGIIQATCSLLAKSEVETETTMDAVPTYASNNEPFNSFNGAIMLDSNANGTRTVIGTVSNIALRVSNSLDGDQFAIDGSRSRADIPEDVRVVNGDITVFFTRDNYELYRRTIDNDTVSLQLTLSRGSYSWQFTIPAIKLRLQTPQVAGRGPLNLEGTFEAFRDVATGTDIQLAITNGDPVISTAA